MLHIPRWKVVLILLVSMLGVLYAAPNMLSPKQLQWVESRLPGWMPNRTVNLGLDLRGGSHLLLEADMNAVFAERVESMAEAARTGLRRENIAHGNVETRKDGIAVTLRDVAADRDAAYKILRGVNDQADIDIDGGTGMATVTLNDQAMNDIRTQALAQSIEIVRRRVDESGTKEPIIQRQGTDRIVVQLPGEDNPENVKALIGKTAKMTFHLVDEDSFTTGRVGPASRRLPMREDTGQNIVIRKRIIISGDMLVDAQAGFDQSGPVVNFRFDSIGTGRFCAVTKENVGKPFAIVLDGEVISAPVIRDAICGGRGQISGNFTVKEAADLALLLRAGALPAPLNVVEERTVGPTLGADSIAAGKIAAGVAFVLVVALMILVYGLFGFFASVALALNIVMIIAVLSILQATLTLPGIAGIILTIGIAVDANVLIYERIREELRRGDKPVTAIDTGYRLALGTIVDSNLTTLIVALILFSFGTGPVKGFAVAMCIGIVTSMFCAIMVTRLMVVTWLRQKRPQTLQL